MAPPKDAYTSEHDLLIRLDSKMDSLIEVQAELKKGMYGDDGQGGLCGRISRLESFQGTILAFAAAISIAITAAGSWVLSHFKVA